MASPFFTALSGLSANMRSLSVIGNNLANMNTVGYKGSVISFQDLVARGALSFNGAGNPSQDGLGVSTAAVSTNFNQGSLQRTGQPLDVSIVGAGFLVVNEGTRQLYTRAGNLTLDSEGNVLTQQGYHVRGFPSVDGQIDTTQGLSNLRIDPGSTVSARATSLVRFVTNIDAELQTGESFSTSLQVVDTLGGQHAVTLEFTKQAGIPITFSFDALVDGADVAGGTPGVRYSVLTQANQAAAPGTVVFDTDGTLASVDIGGGVIAPPTDFALDFSLPAFPGFANGAEGLAITVDLVDNAGEARLTSFASPSSTVGTFQDGSTSANLLTFSVDPDGIIQGIYSNGETQPLGQLAIAMFNNPQGLVRLGENTFSAGVSSGGASIGTANAGGRGGITGGALELSNVDIADEFTKLIIAQRGYQANSRVVTTTDEVTQEAINLKR